jgi:hypothetical protein
MAHSSLATVPVHDLDEIEEVSDAEREQRKKLLGTAAMSSQRLAPHQIVIFNISKHGLGARSLATPPEMGEAVTVTLAGDVRDLQGVVCWVEGDRFGVQVDRAIRTDLFELNHRRRDCVQDGQTWEVSNIYKLDPEPVDRTAVRPC